MAQKWLFLKSAAPEVSATALKSATLYSLFIQQKYTTEEMLGVVYDLYAHELYVQAHSLLRELLIHIEASQFRVVLNSLLDQLGNELFDTVAGFCELLKQYEIY